MTLVTGLLAWGAVYAFFLLVFPFLSTPDHRLSGYLLFELVGLLPWTLWLFWTASRRSPATAMSVVVQACAVLAVSYPVHIAATHRLCWAYFQDKDRLLGPVLGGVPVEEFLFYPLTVNFSLLAYLWTCGWLRHRGLSDLAVNRRALRNGLVTTALAFAALTAFVWSLRAPSAAGPVVRMWDGMGVPHYREGPRSYDWTLTCLVSTAANLLLLWVAERRSALNLRAMLPVSAVFVLICMLVDLLGVSRGWWVYNAQQVSDLWIGGIVLESFPVYLTGVMMPLSLFELTRRLLGERGLP